MDNSSFNPHIERAEISKVVIEKFEPERSDSESVKKVKSQISLDRFRPGGNESSSTQINTAVQLNYNESGFTAEGKSQLNMLREFKKGERELEKLKAQKLSSNDTKRKSDVEKQITKLDTELKDLSLKLEKDFKSKTGIEGNFLEIPLEDINELINLPTEHKFTKSEEFEKYISKTDAKQELGKDEAPTDLSTQPIAHKKANEVARRQLTRGNNVNSYEGSKKDKLSLGAVKEKTRVNNESIVVSSEKTKTVLPKKQVFNQNTGSVTSKITDGSDEGSKPEKLHNSSNKIDNSKLKEKIKENPRSFNEQVIEDSEAKKEKSSTIVSRDNRHNNLIYESNFPEKTSKIIVGAKATRSEKIDKPLSYKIETGKTNVEEEVTALPFNKEIFNDLVKKTNAKSQVVSKSEIDALKKILKTPLPEQIFEEIVKNLNPNTKVVSQEEINTLKKLLSPPALKKSKKVEKELEKVEKTSGKEENKTQKVDPLKKIANFTIVQTMISTENNSLKDLAAQLGIVTTDVLLYTFKKRMTTNELLQNVLICLKDTKTDTQQKNVLIQFCTQIINTGFYDNDFKIKENLILVQNIIDEGNNDKKSQKEAEELKKGVQKFSIEIPNKLKEKEQATLNDLLESIPIEREYTPEEVTQFASKFTNLIVQEFVRADISEFLQDKLLDKKNDHLTPHLKNCLNNLQTYMEKAKEIIVDPLADPLADPSSLSFFIDLANEFKKKGDLSSCMATISIFFDGDVSKVIKKSSPETQKKIDEFQQLIFPSGLKAACNELSKNNQPYLLPITTAAKYLIQVNDNANEKEFEVKNNIKWPNIKKLSAIKNVINDSLLLAVEFNNKLEKNS